MATVLLAEDDDGVRELVEFVLTSAGHSVLPCADGRSALAVASAERPDLALLDVNMPGLSGLEVCAALRAQPATAETPVLLLTAHGMHGEVACGYAAGATDYILKPFTATDLLARVDAFLAAPTPAPTPAASPADGRSIDAGGWDRLTGRAGQPSRRA